MLTLKQANMLDLLKINRLNADFLEKRSELNYYSEFNGGFISSLIKGSVYIIENNTIDCGILIVEKGLKELFFIQKCSTVSIFKLLHLLQRNFDLIGFSFKIIYKKINLEELKKYFKITLTENMMYMHFDLTTTFPEQDLDPSNTLLFRPLKMYQEENIRLELQNNIFNNVSGRSMLTIEEVIEEYSNPKFLRNFCFLLEYYRTPIGYGQILKFDSQYMLVNFGIASEHRNKGYGYYFLNNIFRECKRSGMNELYLSVDKYNSPAVALYKRAGFHEIYNKITINFNAKNG